MDGRWSTFTDLHERSRHLGFNGHISRVTELAVVFLEREVDRMTPSDSRVSIHMAASLDGFIALSDGRVDLDGNVGRVRHWRYA